jgi:hypothetical protein
MGNGQWHPEVDKVFTLGLLTDIAVTSAWNGDGITKIGVFRDGNWYLDFSGDGAWTGCGTPSDKDRCYAFGLPTDTPTAGDWDVSGFPKIGVIRGTSCYLDYSGNRSSFLFF